MIKSVPELVVEYAERLALLRSRAADGPRDTYTVALGQLLALGLIEESVYRQAIDRPREGRHA